MSISIGAVIDAHELNDESLLQLKSAGFVTLDIFFWESLDGIDIGKLADSVNQSGLTTSCISIFGNPLMDNEQGFESAEGWKQLTSQSRLFGNPYVSGFAGRPTGKSVTESIDTWKEFFSEILDIAHSNGTRGILFENCRMGDSWKKGNWNIAINPDAWELMFNALNDSLLGLQWEPCHQIEAFADPIPQLEQWISRIPNVHGKDGKTDLSTLKRTGLYGKNKPFQPTLPGEGDTDWKALIEVLNAHDYRGSIDLELQGQPFIPNLAEAKASLSYLKSLLA